MTADTGLAEGTRATEDSGTSEVPSARAPRSRRIARVALVLLTLAAAAGAGLEVRQALHDRRREESVRAATEVAREQTLNMLSVNPDNVESRMHTLLANSTGEFRRDFESVEESFGAVVTKGEVVSTAHVVSSAVTELDDDDARILLAVDSEVRNGKSHQTRTRQYRLVADLTREGERWLVSGMRFVA